MGMGCVICGSEEPEVMLERQEDGGYQATLCGHFTLRIKGDNTFRMRLLILFLGLLDVPGMVRKSRRTRDGRTPFVRQEQMAAWFELPQERVSQYNKYWLEGDWANLLSLKTAEVLTVELTKQVVEVLASFPKWGKDKVYRYLQDKGVKVSRKQIMQVEEQSGWAHLKNVLLQRYDLSQGQFRLRDGWLVQQLLRQVETLLHKIETDQGITSHEQIKLSELKAIASENSVEVEPPLKALPWMLRVEQVLFGHWEMVTDEQIRCSYCGTTEIGRKSKTPRYKKYFDRDGNIQQVAVYRYYCHNPQCDKKTFTNLPSGLMPYSPYRTEVRLLALQMYGWGRSTYRRTGSSLGIASFTTWRWVSEWGHDLLPVAALFGVVKSSGVVGVDEKFVLVPKNDKPDEGKMRRWMYVYLAVDAWTYDLLHIAIYPHNNQDSATAFLLALRAKGYQPTAIITDLRSDYGPAIARVYPQTEHHECIFHAMKNAGIHIKDIYGKEVDELDSDAYILKSAIYHIFDTSSRHVAQMRCDGVLALREAFVSRSSQAVGIFDSLERHWPKLINGIESDLIPTTNNTTELVIRRFDQHYQNFCGFDSIETAQSYLGVFEKLYRFTPFSQDAQTRIRGKSPLQLAGYDVSQLPMSVICSGLSIDWPTHTEDFLVPNL
jgi:transposase-like protein